jgi:hypothetical protein
LFILPCKLLAETNGGLLDELVVVGLVVGELVVLLEAGCVELLDVNDVVEFDVVVLGVVVGLLAIRIDSNYYHKCALHFICTNLI